MIFLPIFSTFVFSPLLASEESSEGEEVYHIDDVIVQGRPEHAESSVAVEKISAEDIEISGARNVVEAVKLLPGIDVSTGGQGVARLNIRGFRMRHVLLLLDGVPLNSAYDQQFDASLTAWSTMVRIFLRPILNMYGLKTWKDIRLRFQESTGTDVFSASAPGLFTTIWKSLKVGLFDSEPKNAQKQPSSYLELILVSFYYF